MSKWWIEKNQELLMMLNPCNCLFFMAKLDVNITAIALKIILLLKRPIHWNMIYFI